MSNQDPVLLNALRMGIVEVTFQKVNGEKRVMPCTLNENFIPADKYPKGTATPSKSTTATAVFATDVQEWRSFRNDSVITWDVVE
jgi:hypothetical protein